MDPNLMGPSCLKPNLHHTQLPIKVERFTMGDRHPVKRKQMRVDESGRVAITHCKTLHFDRELSVVQIGLETGRTHQIRVHMQHHRTPVLGDALYGSEGANRKYGAMRQMLHAHKLALTHPITAESLTFVADIPEDLNTFYRKVQAREGSF